MSDTVGKSRTAAVNWRALIGEVGQLGLGGWVVRVP